MFRNAVNNDDVGVRYVGSRLPQRTGRQHASIAEATGSIDDDNLAIPGQAKVLQPVVRHDDIDTSRHEGLRGCHTIASDEGDALGAAVQQQRLVTHVLPVGSFVHLTRRVGGFRPVATRHDSHPQPTLRQVARQPDDQRGLARAAYCEIPDDDDGFINMMGSQPTPRVSRGTHADRSSVKPCEGLQQRRSRSVAIPELREPLLHELNSNFELHAMQLGVDAVLVEELGVGAGLDEITAIENDDAVGLLHG